MSSHFVLSIIIYSTKYLVSDWPMANAYIGYRVQSKVIECNTEVAMETPGKRQV